MATYTTKPPIRKHSEHILWIRIPFDFLLSTHAGNKDLMQQKPWNEFLKFWIWGTELPKKCIRFHLVSAGATEWSEKAFHSILTTYGDLFHHSLMNSKHWASVWIRREQTPPTHFLSIVWLSYARGPTRDKKAARCWKHRFLLSSPDRFHPSWTISKFMGQ